MSSDAAKNAYQDEPYAGGDMVTVAALREAYDRGAREKEEWMRAEMNSLRLVPEAE